MPPYAFLPLTIGFGVDPLTIRCARNTAAVTPPYVPCSVVGTRDHPEAACGSPESPLSRPSTQLGTVLRTLWPRFTGRRPDGGR